MTDHSQPPRPIMPDIPHEQAAGAEKALVSKWITQHEGYIDEESHTADVARDFARWIIAQGWRKA